MIGAWMVHALVVSLLLGMAAVAMESALRLRGWSGRWVWAGALAGSALLPLAALLPAAERAPAPTIPAPGAEGAGAALPALDLAVVERSRGWLDAAASLLARLDAPLLALWIGGSVLLALWVAAAQWRLLRRRRAWRRAEVDGVPVLVSRGVGPAVVGFVRSAIVVPEWALSVERRLRALMLAHEEEHLRAGDPRLLVAGLAVLALMPWNPVVWWQLRRLRLAVEVDCDARVLRRHPDLRAYGALLLELGQRRSTAPWAVVAAFSEPASTLERRIRMMTSRTPRGAAARAALSAGAGALLVLAACETPTPTQLAPRDGAVVYAAEGVAPTAEQQAPHHREAVRLHFPEVLARGMGDAAALAFVVGADGAIQEARALPKRSTPELRRDQIDVRTEPGSDVTTFTVPRFDQADFGTLGIAPDRIAMVEIFRTPAGALGPDPVSTVWIRLRGEGEAGGTATTTFRRGVGEERVTVVRPGAAAETRADFRSREEGTVEVTVRRDGAGEAVQVIPARPGTGGAPAPVDALFVVDGVVKPEGFDPTREQLTPDLIERVEILRGPAAIERFGARAEKGVVMITTRSAARSGGPR